MLLRNSALAASAGLAMLFALPPLAAPAAGTAAAKVEISKRDCQRLVRHQARNDVNFKPGVDVRGRRVAPADLDGGSPIKVPNIITFDLTADLTKYMDLPADSPIGGEASLGKIKFDIAKNRLTFNGEPVGARGQAELAHLCASMVGTK